jgi:hypothetical protein
LRNGYRNQASSAVAVSVRSSRYFTMTGVWSESPSFAQELSTCNLALRAQKSDFRDGKLLARPTGLGADRPDEARSIQKSLPAFSRFPT